MRTSIVFNTLLVGQACTILRSNTRKSFCNVNVVAPSQGSVIYGYRFPLGPHRTLGQQDCNTGTATLHHGCLVCTWPGLWKVRCYPVMTTNYLLLSFLWKTTSTRCVICCASVGNCILSTAFVTGKMMFPHWVQPMYEKTQG